MASFQGFFFLVSDFWDSICKNCALDFQSNLRKSRGQIYEENQDETPTETYSRRDVQTVYRLFIRKRTYRENAENLSASF